MDVRLQRRIAGLIVLVKRRPQSFILIQFDIGRALVQLPPRRAVTAVPCRPNSGCRSLQRLEIVFCAGNSSSGILCREITLKMNTTSTIDSVTKDTSVTRRRTLRRRCLGS